MDSVEIKGDTDQRRAPLTRGRVLEAAVDLADREGIDAVSMRRLGQELGIEAMSLYTHIRGKEDLLDGMVDVVVAEIPVDTVGPDWRATLRRQILDARGVMLRHRWAARIIETRTAPGLATLGYMEAATGIIRDGGFSVDLTHHAMHVLGSRVLGFNQDLYDDSGTPDEAAAAFAAQLASTYPNIAAIAGAASHEGGLGGCDDDYEFEFGLDLILDGLERRRAGKSPRS
ncbi:MAG: TetR/AcrR family transcriptional regulator [Chloroflexota bacterium]